MLAHRHNESSQTMLTTTTTIGYSAANEELHNILCTHDGVLLKKAGAENISEINTSGSLSLVEYTQPSRIYVEWHQWRPNENELIASDSVVQDDWALVDTIAERRRTISECSAFNIKPPTDSIILQSNANKSRSMRTQLEDLSSLEVKNRGQTIRFIRKSDGTLHSEFFFQHANADQFVRSMLSFHIIENVSYSRHGDEYIILPNETQKLKKTFAELDIGEIKASSLGNENSLSNKVFGFLANFPDYVPPPFQKNAPRTRPGTLDYRERHKSTSTTTSDNYQMVGFNSNSPSREKSPDSEIENVKEVDTKVVNIKLPERQPVVRGAPLTETQWLEFKTPDGRISDPLRIREIIFRGGIVPNLRAEVWKYLLNYYQWSDSETERLEYRKRKYKEYYTMKAQWLSMTTTQENNFSGYRDRKCQIEKDVKRTDRSLEFFAGEDNPNLLLLQEILMTYVMYNFDLGYVQGMSDLLAPILEIQREEVDAFWCFVGFMNMVFANFDIDQAGMKTQFGQLRRLLEFANPRFFNYMGDHDSDNMYFCFRWLLVWFKREFSNEDVLKLWECLWTNLPCPNFHLLVSVAILDQETDLIIENKYEFTEILKHVNELSGHIDLKQTLEIAEAIYRQIKAANDLPNDIRAIIGEPLIEVEGTISEDFDNIFDDIVRELSPEELRRKQMSLEEAYERSISFQFL